MASDTIQMPFLFLLFYDWEIVISNFEILTRACLGEIIPDMSGMLKSRTRTGRILIYGDTARAGFTKNGD